MLWTVWEDEPADPQAVMDSDYERLLNLTAASNPVLRFYSWKGDCATYGYFLNPLDYLNPEGVQTAALQLARRPTGGGIIFHMSDLAFSVLVPAGHPAYSCNTLENYAFVNRRVAAAIQQFRQASVPQLLEKNLNSAGMDFCMAKPTIYDVMIDGLKVGGAAQRRTKQGFLHQGSLCLKLSEVSWLKSVLNDPEQVISQMYQHSYPLLAEWEGARYFQAKENIKRHLAHAFTS